MAPIKVIKVTPQTKPQPPTTPAQHVQVPGSAPTQVSAVTGKGTQPKTAATFNQAPTLKPNPPDNGSTKVIQDQRQPAPRGPRAPLGGNGYGN